MKSIHAGPVEVRHTLTGKDEAAIADLIARSGSAAELHVWQGMVHVFPADLALLQAAREALDIAADFLRGNLERHLTPGRFHPFNGETP